MSNPEVTVAGAGGVFVVTLGRFLGRVARIARVTAPTARRARDQRPLSALVEELSSVIADHSEGEAGSATDDPRFWALVTSLYQRRPRAMPARRTTSKAGHARQVGGSNGAEDNTTIAELVEDEENAADAADVGAAETGAADAGAADAGGADAGAAETGAADAGAADAGTAETGAKSPTETATESDGAEARVPKKGRSDRTDSPDEE